VLEVGSWVGDSAEWFAHGASRVYCVDTWAGPCKNEEEYLSNLYRQFLSNMIHAGVADKVTPIRMASLEAAMSLDVEADLIYIDGDHSSQAVYYDILAWDKHLTTDGILCGDDWAWNTVQFGVHQAAEELGLKVRSSATGRTWWLE
jgi:predicted O-methyltransferase YrrM